MKTFSKPLLCISLIASCLVPRSGAAQEFILREATATIQQPHNLEAYWKEDFIEINLYEITTTGASEKAEAILIYSRSTFPPDIPVLKGDLILPSSGMDDPAHTEVWTPLDYPAHPATRRVKMHWDSEKETTETQLQIRGREMEIVVSKAGQTDTTLLPATYLEDDVRNRIRFDPGTLPLGKIQMVPSLSRIPDSSDFPGIHEAVANLFIKVKDDAGKQVETYNYHLNYPELGISLMIECESTFPYRILKFVEMRKHTDKSQSYTSTAVVKNHVYRLAPETKEEWEALWESFGVQNPPDLRKMR